MTFNLDIWSAGSSWHYLGQVRRARPQVKDFAVTGGTCSSSRQYDLEWGLSSCKRNRSVSASWAYIGLNSLCGVVTTGDNGLSLRWWHGLRLESGEGSLIAESGRGGQSPVGVKLRTKSIRKWSLFIKMPVKSAVVSEKMSQKLIYVWYFWTLCFPCVLHVSWFSGFCVVFMAALCNRGPLYFYPVVSIFLLLSCTFILRLISAVADWMSIILRHIVWPYANLECRSETCCTRLGVNTGRKKSPKIAIWAPSHNFLGLYLCN